MGQSSSKAKKSSKNSSEKKQDIEQKQDNGANAQQASLISEQKQNEVANVPPDFSLAASLGYTDIVRYWLAPLLGVDVNGFDYAGRSALDLACQNGHVEVVRLLLGHPEINPNAHCGPLVSATEKGHIEIVGLLLKHPKTDVNQTDPFSGRTALHVAAKNGRADIMALLCEHKDIKDNEPDNMGDTPLLLATESGCLECVEILLKRFGPGALKQYNKNGDGPLHKAAFHGYADIMKVLLTHCSVVELNKKNGQGDTPLHCAVKKKYYEPVHAAIVGLLVQQPGLEINAKNIYSQTALQCAASEDAVEAVEFLLERPEIDLNCIASGSSALDTTAAKHLFSHQGIEIRKLLVWHGATVSERILRYTGNTSEQFYEKYSMSVFVDQKFSDLLKNVIQGAREQDADKLDVLFEVSQWKASDPLLKPYYLDAGLVLSSYEGKTFLQKFFLDKGARPNRAMLPFSVNYNISIYRKQKIGLIDLEELDGQTPLTALMLNTKLSPEQIEQGINRLIQRGASVNITNRQQQSPLIVATLANNPNAVKALLEYKPLLSQTWKGKTAFEIAGDPNFKDIRALLCEVIKKSDQNPEMYESKESAESMIIAALNGDKNNVSQLLHQLKALRQEPFSETTTTAPATGETFHATTILPQPSLIQPAFPASISPGFSMNTPQEIEVSAPPAPPSPAKVPGLPQPLPLPKPLLFSSDLNKDLVFSVAVPDVKIPVPKVEQQAIGQIEHLEQVENPGIESAKKHNPLFM